MRSLKLSLELLGVAMLSIKKNPSEEIGNKYRSTGVEIFAMINKEKFLDFSNHVRQKIKVNKITPESPQFWNIEMLRELYCFTSSEGILRGLRMASYGLLNQSDDRLTRYNESMALLRSKFIEFEKEALFPSPEHFKISSLFREFDEAMKSFNLSVELSERELQEWSDRIDILGIRACRIYKNLKTVGINVEYDANLMKNRIDSCGFGPDNLHFHLHPHAIEDLLNFCVIGCANYRKIQKLKEEFPPAA